MALFNPCESCKYPQFIRQVSEQVESTLPSLHENSKIHLNYAQNEDTPDPEKEQRLGVVANTGALLAEVHIIAERANARSCDLAEESCDRALFVMHAFSAALDDALASRRELQDGLPPVNE